MPTFSAYFQIGKSQSELDFVDIDLERDTRLYIDPFAISQRPDRWSQEAHALIVAFFQKLVDLIRDGKEDGAKELLLHLHEPNETRFGLSANEPHGAGIGAEQAAQLYELLSSSSAVKTGSISSLEECELMVAGISWDKISDLTTNIIRKKLAEYTFNQCELHGIPTVSVALDPYFCLATLSWNVDYFNVPTINNLPILLVPKAIARRMGCFDHQKYYRHFALNFLKQQHLEAGSSLVRALKNGKKRVYKTDLAELYPCTKDFLLRFSTDNPQVLAKYKKDLAKKLKEEPSDTLAAKSDTEIARSLRLILKRIPRGNLKASEYHRFMIGFLEFIFYPWLICPRKEQEINSGRKRIDIVMENSAYDGIFHRMHHLRNMPCAYIAFECKNYSNDITNPELDQLAGRFSPNRGKVGFICCRKFDDRLLFIKRCRDTFKEERGLVIPIDDLTADSLLRLIEDGHRDQLDAVITKLVDEVWLS